MSTATTASAPSFQLTNGLSTEISILQSILKRNYHAHHRTKYFRHVQMSLLHLNRHSIITHLEEIGYFIQMYRLKYLSKKRIGVTSSSELSHEDYELINDRKTVLNVPLNNKQGTSTKKQEQLFHNLQWLNHCIIHTLPEAINRIENTCNMITEENISKGYYLSLSCVIVASFARVRHILLHLGRNNIHEFLMYLECSSIEKNDNNVLINSIIKTFCTLPDNCIGKFMVKQNVSQNQQHNHHDQNEMNKSSRIINNVSSSSQQQEDIGESIHSNNNGVTLITSSNDNSKKRKESSLSLSKSKKKQNKNNNDVHPANIISKPIKNKMNKNGIYVETTTTALESISKKKKKQLEQNIKSSNNNNNSTINATNQSKKRNEILSSNGSGSTGSLSKSKKKKKRKKKILSNLDDIFKA